MKVFDVFLFGYELDLLEIRMNLLDPYVDYFVFSEGGKTFSGEDKGFVFKKTDKRFNNKGQAFLDFSKYEKDYIERFAKENNHNPVDLANIIKKECGEPVII